MSQRSFSVLVVPGQWDGTGDALAERLVSVTRQPTGRLADALRRGPVTLDADLHREEAERLLEQLERLDVPAEIRDESDDKVVQATGAVADGRDDEESQEGADDDAWGEFDDLQDSLESVVESADLDDASREFEDLESVDETSESEETSDDRSGGRADVASVDGWDAVLGRSDEQGGSGEEPDGDGAGAGDVAEEGAASADEGPAADEGIPAPSDVSDEVPGDVSSVEVAESESAATNAPAGAADMAADSGRGLQNIEEADEHEPPALEELSEDSGADPQTSEDAQSPALDSPADPPESSLSLESDPGGAGDGGAMETDAFGPSDTGLDEAVPRTDESEFDGAAMTEALTDSGRSSTFDDGTFDDRPEHIPALAAVLSLIAPGAGQIYNGESDKAWTVAARAILVVPWVRAVRDALRRGRAIRNQEAPRPPEGSFVSALKHAAVIYSALVAFGVGSYLVVQVASNQINSGETVDPAMPQLDIENAFREAELAVHGARIDAWKRTGEKRVSDDERFTMSDEARAARLFAIGYRHCRAGDHRMCESAMRKVARLDSPYRRRAYRLQAWASVQQEPDEPQSPMPDVEISEGLLEGNKVDPESDDSVGGEAVDRDAGEGDEPRPDVEGESRGTTLSPGRDDDSLREDLE
jgi:hypothetical protein